MSNRDHYPVPSQNYSLAHQLSISTHLKLATRPERQQHTVSLLFICLSSYLRSGATARPGFLCHHSPILLEFLKQNTSPAARSTFIKSNLPTASMAFGASVRSACAALALVATLALTQQTQQADAWVAPVVAKGNKFFNSETGEEFRLKGMAYYPRPNAGEMADVGNYDWAADEHENVWKPHLEIMKELGVNTIRLYSVDPGKSHDKFMCACSEAGIYVLVGVTAPCENCSVYDELPPKCYHDSLFTRAQVVYNAFAVYDNTLGFSIGNENNLQTLHGKEGIATAPCVKAFLRDTRSYAASCSGNVRQVPIGLDIADIPPRDQWLKYYDCAINDDENTRADWIGFNPYVECDPIDHTKYSQSTGLQTLMKVYDDAAYPRPLMFGEFGCNEGVNTIDGFENQRSFYDAKWMNEEADMTEKIVGGNVFEFTTELTNLKGSKTLSKKKDAGKFGIGYFMPETCDHDTVPCVFTPYPEFEALKTAYTTTKNSSVTLSSYTPKRDTVLSCPSTMSTDLPPTPGVEILACTVAQPVCNGKKANSGKKVAVNTKVGEKLTVGTVSAPNLDNAGTSFNNTGSGSAAGSVSAVGAIAFSVASVVIGSFLSL